jgi:hypothetical protein
MEARFGVSFGDVRIHADTRAAAAAAALGANAFTHGRSISFGTGRYDPGSPEGRRLLAHELAHVAHGAEAGATRAGVAPESSRAEALAERAAAGDVEALAGFRDWGPAWEIHRQVSRIARRGTVQHTGEVGRAPGEMGVPYGAVEVRTGEDIEFRGGARLPNVIALAYSGSFSADSRWLQYVWFEMVLTVLDATRIPPLQMVRVAATVPTTSGTKPFTTDPAAPRWSIDAATAASPYYEAGGANLRDQSSTTIFDAPGGASVRPIADAAISQIGNVQFIAFTAHFETYLIQANRARYRVGYSATTVFVPNPGGATTVSAIGYTVGASGQVSALPADRKAMLDAAYPAFTAVQ